MVACGAFCSETSLILFIEAVVTLAGFFVVVVVVIVVVVVVVVVCVFFFRSHHFALSPRSERLEQASVSPVGDRS